MESLNRIEIQGVVGTIDTRQVGDKLHANFSVATNYVSKDKQGEALIETTWHRVSAFEGENITADTLNAIHNGNVRDIVNVRVVGRIRQRRYADAYGNENSTYEIIANEVKILK